MRMLPAMQPIGCAVLVICLGILTPPDGQADIYVWTDANGVRHFADKPPQGDVSAVRRFREIRYDAAAGRDNQMDDRRSVDRRARENRDRGRGRRPAQADTRRSRRPQAMARPQGNGRQIAAPLPEWPGREAPDRDYRIRRRPSKRERGVTSGLTRVVRAIPSPYYMGYRPVYSRDSTYRSRRGAQGRRGSGCVAGGSRRSGGRGRASF